MTTTATRITDLTTATPAEIDTEIARICDAINELQARIEQANRRARYGDLHEVAQADALVAELGSRQDALRDQLAPLHAEWTRRGGWTRYYLVDSHDGHVHKSTHCSTCFPTTRYYWLTSESGKTAEQVVAEAQAQACTVCFPGAPVTDQRGRYRTPSQAEAEQRAAERAAKAAAKKAAEITTPDGGVLWSAYMRADGDLGNDDRLRTEASAWRRTMDRAGALAFYGSDHPDAPGWTETINRCVAALAAHRKVTEQSLRDQLTAKIAAKARREDWRVQP